MPHNISTMPVPLTGSLDEFEVSQNGFLPKKLPLQRLSDQYYEGWELVLDHLPTLLATASLRKEVDRLPVLSTSRLISQREWQRVYLILSFMTHSYIWEAGGPSEVRRALPHSSPHRLTIRSDYPPLSRFHFCKCRHISDSHQLQLTRHSISGTTPPYHPPLPSTTLTTSAFCIHSPAPATKNGSTSSPRPSSRMVHPSSPSC